MIVLTRRRHFRREHSVGVAKLSETYAFEVEMEEGAQIRFDVAVRCMTLDMVRCRTRLNH